MKWEYRVESLSNSSDYELAKVANDFGGDGWELVSATVLTVGERDSYTLFFKRKVFVEVPAEEPEETPEPQPEPEPEPEV